MGLCIATSALPFLLPSPRSRKRLNGKDRDTSFGKKEAEEEGEEEEEEEGGVFSLDGIEYGAKTMISFIPFNNFVVRL